ncbi:MAG TPA: hypothetical protein PLT63_06885, partial [Syntrophales bacterium]|nr:hypothetical protein [Syntrophales bacterium]
MAAKNSMGFHDPDQLLNTLGRSIDMAHQAIATTNRAGTSSYDLSGCIIYASICRRIKTMLILRHFSM